MESVFLEYNSKNESSMLTHALHPFNSRLLTNYLNFDKIVITKDLFKHYIGLFTSLNINDSCFFELRKECIECLCKHGYQLDFDDLIFLEDYSYYNETMNVTEKEKVYIRKLVYKNSYLTHKDWFKSFLKKFNDPYLNLIYLAYNQTDITTTSLSKVYDRINPNRLHLHLFIINGEVSQVKRLKTVIDFYKKKGIHMEAYEVNNYKFRTLKSGKRPSAVFLNMIDHLNKIYSDRVYKRPQSLFYYRSFVDYELIYKEPEKEKEKAVEKETDTEEYNIYDCAPNDMVFSDDDNEIVISKKKKMKKKAKKKLIQKDKNKI